MRGPASQVELVDRAVAFVSIPASGIDVNEAVDLVAVDVSGQPVAPGMVELDPETVSVQVSVREIETQTTVAVRPTVEPGSPAPGFALEALSVDPSTVTIVGLPEDLAEIGRHPDRADQHRRCLERPDLRGRARAARWRPRSPSGEPENVTVSATIGPSVSSRTFVVGVRVRGRRGERLPSRPRPGLDHRERQR